MLELRELRTPIICAPMAGGPSTPALAAAVSRSGGLGMLAAGYRQAQDVADDITRTRELARGCPIGVNLFVPAQANPAEQDARGSDVCRSSAVADYATELLVTGDLDTSERGPVNGRDDDSWDAKLEVLEALPVECVTLTFGCPGFAVVARLKATSAAVGVTVTSTDEAAVACTAGADFLVVQGSEAGGHRGTHRVDVAPNTESTIDLVRQIGARGPGVPLVAAGGIYCAADTARALAAGASAVQAGTAFLLTEEAGTNPVHRAALMDHRFTTTALTRAFTGRVARSLANGFMERHPSAPAAYPEVHQLTGPMRARAKSTGDADRLHLWAGTGWRFARAQPAAEIVALLSPERDVA